jgi:hypothetical protein
LIQYASIRTQSEAGASPRTSGRVPREAVPP